MPKSRRFSETKMSDFPKSTFLFNRFCESMNIGVRHIVSPLFELAMWNRLAGQLRISFKTCPPIN